MIIKRKNKITVSGFDIYFELANLSSGELLVNFWDIRALNNKASNDIHSYYIDEFLSEEDRLQYISELELPPEHVVIPESDENIIKRSNLYFELLSKITGESKLVLRGLTVAAITGGI